MYVSQHFDSSLNRTDNLSQLDSRCDKTAWLVIFYYTFATLFAQLTITLRSVPAPDYVTLIAYRTLRVYAVTGKNRWIAFCLYFMSFAQAAFGIASSIYNALHPGRVLLPSLRSKPLGPTQLSQAVVWPDLPLPEYQVCSSQLHKNIEMPFLVLSLVYGTFFLVSTAYFPASKPFFAKDALALLIIVYYPMHRDGGLSRGGGGGVPSLLQKIRQDATTYFLILSTGHIIFLFFEGFAPVSDHPVDSPSTAHDKTHRLQLSEFLRSKSPSQILQQRLI